MSQPARNEGNFEVSDKARLFYYLIAGLILYLAAVAFVYFQWRQILAYVALGAPIGLFILTQPRLALYQYVFCLYVHYFVVGSIPLLLADLSALVLILAAVLDLLVGGRLPGRLPRLFYNFVFLLAALVLAAIFGHDMMAAFRPLARVTLLLATFLAVFRLAGKTGTGGLLRLYFWLCVGHSVLVSIPFIESGGVLRSFGLSGKYFDELAMFALPVGSALYLWSRRGTGGLYLAGSLVTLVGLLATQSRAPILFAALAVVLVLWLSWRRLRAMGSGTGGDTGEVDRHRLPAYNRLRFMVLTVLVLIPLVILATPGVFSAVLGRFERLFTTDPGGTFALRLVLWKTALIAFWGNPVSGVGPGLFRSLADIYPTLHLTPVFYYVQHMSAHNLFLHYLAETGLVGTSALMALFVNQFRIGRKSWKITEAAHTGEALAQYVICILFVVSTLIESGWMWGQLGFIMVFFLGVLTRRAGT
jgi:O-antigen ligase